jgi:ketosteroid isomerase-like protein
MKMNKVKKTANDRTTSDTAVERSPRVAGKTIHWKWTDGPMKGSSQEFIFNHDGTVLWNCLGGPAEGHSAKEKSYAAADVTEEVVAISYLSSTGYPLSVILNFQDHSMVGFASNGKDWSPCRGTFEVMNVPQDTVTTRTIPENRPSTVPDSVSKNNAVHEEAAVRAVLETLKRAVRTKDAEAMLAQCAPDIATFDMIAPLKHEGGDALRRRWAKTLASFEPPLDYDLAQLEIFVDGHVAFARGLAYFGGTQADGEIVRHWLCTTFGLRKKDDHWKLVHEHVSVPFDMETGKAQLDLKPSKLHLQDGPPA